MLAAALNTSLAVSAQINVQMSQYMFNGMVVNPAHTGEREALNIQALARLQWMGIAGAPSTQIVSADAPIAAKSGIGLTLLRETIGTIDRWGGLGNIGAYANYAYRLRVNDLGDRLNFGLAAGFVQNSYNAYDPAVTNGFGSNLYDDGDEVLSSKKPDRRADFKAGIMYEMRDIFYAGISATNLGSFLPLSDADSVVQSPIAMLHGGANIAIGEALALRPSLLYMQPLRSSPLGAFPPSGTLDAGLALVVAARVWLGMSARTTIGRKTAFNAISFMVEAYVSGSLRLGYCYDMPQSGIGSAWGGSHEVSLGYTMNSKTTKYKSARDF